MLIGKMPRDEIAKEVGVSVSSLKRAFRGTRICFFNKHVANPDRVKQVCQFYEEHGREATQKAFPEIKVRSIVERYKLYDPRQVRWTDEQIILAAKYAGILSYDQQAEIFNRPNAHAGSIKSLWMKRFRMAGGSINGMSEFMARTLVTDKCPFVQTRFWETRRGDKSFSRKLYLWVDMEKHLLPDVPDFIRSAIESMADFQRWLFESNNPRNKILKILKNETSNFERL